MPAPLPARTLPRRATRPLAPPYEAGTARLRAKALAGDEAARRSAWLAAWHADPIAVASAEHQLATGRETGLPPDGLQSAVRRWVLRSWAGRPVQSDYEVLYALAREGWERGVVELVQGQLLMSRKLTGAMDRLQAGFDGVVEHLGARDYFTVLRRHELMARLYLSPQAAAPRSLDELLLEASVIRRLEGQARQPGRCACHTDLAG